MTDKQIIIDDQKKTIHRLQEECTEKTNIIIALGEQLKAKEQECEELKKWKKEHLKDVEFIERNPVIDILNLMADNILLEQRNEKLKQAITEIKEIAEKSCYLQPTSTCEEYENCQDCGRTSDDETVKQILQKISEAKQ